MLDKILNFIASTLKKSFIGTVSDVYWWQTSWTAPSDGILVIRIIPSASNWYFYVDDTTINATTGSWAHQFRGTTNEAVTKTIPVKKGSKYSTAAMGAVNVINCFFYPIIIGGGYCIAVFSMLSAIGRWWEHVRQDFKSHSGKAVTAWHRILSQFEREYYIHRHLNPGARCEHYASGRNIYHQSTSWISDSLGEQKHEHPNWSHKFRMGVSKNRLCRWVMGWIRSNSYKVIDRTDYSLLFSFEHESRKRSTNEDRSRSHEMIDGWGWAVC